MSPQELKQKHDLEINILYVNSLLTAIPKPWIHEVEKSGLTYKEIPQFTVIITNCPKLISTLNSRDIYWEQLKKTIKPPTAIRTWVDLFPFLEKVDWINLVRLVTRFAAEPYLQTL